MKSKEIWVVAAGDFGERRYNVYGPFSSYEEAEEAQVKLLTTHDSAHVHRLIKPR